MPVFLEYIEGIIQLPAIALVFQIEIECVTASGDLAGNCCLADLTWPDLGNRGLAIEGSLDLGSYVSFDIHERHRTTILENPRLNLGFSRIRPGCTFGQRFCKMREAGATRYADPCKNTTRSDRAEMHTPGDGHTGGTRTPCATGRSEGNDPERAIEHIWWSKTSSRHCVSHLGDSNYDWLMDAVPASVAGPDYHG